MAVYEAEDGQNTIKPKVARDARNVRAVRRMRGVVVFMLRKVNR